MKRTVHYNSLADSVWHPAKWHWIPLLNQWVSIDSGQVEIFMSKVDTYYISMMIVLFVACWQYHAYFSLPETYIFHYLGFSAVVLGSWTGCWLTDTLLLSSQKWLGGLAIADVILTEWLYLPQHPWPDELGAADLHIQCYLWGRNEFLSFLWVSY